MSYADIPLKPNSKFAIDLSDWEFDDAFKGELDKMIKRQLAERLEVLFGENGIRTSLYLWDEEGAPIALKVTVEISDDDCFEADIDLFEFLEKPDFLANDPESARLFAGELRELAARVEQWADNGAPPAA